MDIGRIHGAEPLPGLRRMLETQVRSDAGGAGKDAAMVGEHIKAETTVQVDAAMRDDQGDIGVAQAGKSLIQRGAKMPLSPPIGARGRVGDKGVAHLSGHQVDAAIGIDEDERYRHAIDQSYTRPPRRNPLYIGLIRAIHDLANGRPALFRLGRQIFDPLFGRLCHPSPSVASSINCSMIC